MLSFAPISGAPVSGKVGPTEGLLTAARGVFVLTGGKIGLLRQVAGVHGQVREDRRVRLLLREPLPLRTTRMLGDYAEDVVLPEVFGDLTRAAFPLIRLSATRYFAADHPLPITTVYAARQVVTDWERVLQFDGDGRTWTEVHFAAPVPQGTEIAACGSGRLDDDTGAMIENPADVARRITQMAGRDDDWSPLRAECAALDIRIAGRIWQRLKVNEQIDAVMESVGAIWNRGMARLYPTTADPSPIFDLDWREVGGIQVSASANDTADVLRLAYDWSDASGRALHYIELSASPRRYGGLSKEVVYPFLRTPANAEAVGRPVLQRLAGDRYDVTFMTSNMTIRTGDWVRPVAHPEWPLPGADPVIMVLKTEIDWATRSIRCTGETVLGDKPIVTVTGHSIALPDTVQDAIDVVFRDGIATFTVTDADGKPIAGARVSLDGAAPRTTNAQGKVSFTAIAGVHEVAVEAVGYVPFTVRMTL